MNNIENKDLENNQLTESDSQTTEYGTTYFYTGKDAAKVVAMANVTLEALLADQKQQQAASAIDSLIKAQPTGDIVIISTVAAAASAVAATVGPALVAAAPVAAAASSATIAATGIASLVLSSSDSGTEALDINVANNTFSPLVCYKFNTHGCANASLIPSLLPGASGSMTVVSSTDSGFAGSNNSSIGLSFLVGSGFYTPEGQSDPVELQSIKAKIEFFYNSNKIWYPKFTIDGAEAPMSDDGYEGLSAVCFVPNQDSQATGFTIASGLVQKGSCGLGITFLPITPQQIQVAS